MFDRVLNTFLHEIVLIEIIVFKIYVVGCYVASDKYIISIYWYYAQSYGRVLEASLSELKDLNFVTL